MICIGSFLKLLKLCKMVSVTQKYLCTQVIKTLDPTWDMGDDDSAISAIMAGKRNISTDVYLNDNEIDSYEVACRFKENVCSLIDENKKNNLVYAIIDLLKNASSIRNNTKVEVVNGFDLEKLLSMNVFVFHELLAGVFIYLLKNTSNLHMQDVVKKVSEEYIDTFSNRPLLTFVESYSMDNAESLQATIDDIRKYNKTLVITDAKCIKCGRVFEESNFKLLELRNGRNIEVCYRCYPSVIESKDEIEKQVCKLISVNTNRDSMAINVLEDDVKEVIKRIARFDVIALNPSRMNPKTVQEKLGNTNLARGVMHDVNDMFNEVKNTINALADEGKLNVNRLYRTVKRLDEDCDETITDEEKHKLLVELVYEQTGRISYDASRIIIAYFIQSCEVFK